MLKNSVDGERAALTRDVRAKNLLEYWVAQPEFQMREPASPAVAHLWKWIEIGPLLRKSSQVVGVGANVAEAERRALIFANPGLDRKAQVTTTMYADYQLVKPGEAAPAHRHTATAVRFVIEGDGAFTTIEGEKVRMTPGDLIINPGWLWHDFGNEGVDDAIWLDVLDVPLVTGLNSVFYDYDYFKQGDTDKTIQTVRHADDRSHNLYFAGGMTPRFGSHHATPRGHSPLLVYRWEHVAELLKRNRFADANPYDGILIEYTDPLTGASAVPTMSCSIQLLRSRQHTLRHRHTHSSVYCVFAGRGATVVDGVSLDWEKNDVFVVPGWAWHDHVNLGSEDAVLFSVSDEPAVRKLGLRREEGMEELRA